MFGMGAKTFNSSKTSVYLLLFITIANEFILIHSFVSTDNEQNQNQLEHSQKDTIQQLLMKYIATLEHSASADDNLQSSSSPAVQRRFCCMNPLGGRKRSVRNLVRKQQQQLSDGIVE